MADNQPSKSAKKNAKRRAAKQKQLKETPGFGKKEQQDTKSPEQMLETLKKQLELAKENKNHGRAGELRDQIWVLTDLIRGIRTNIPDKELDPILESIAKAQSEETSSTPSQSAETSSAPSQSARTQAVKKISTSSGLTTEEKRIQTLRKKLQQIKGLKDKETQGVKLEREQIKKINSEEQVLEEIKELETLIAEALAS